MEEIITDKEIEERESNIIFFNNNKYYVLELNIGDKEDESNKWINGIIRKIKKWLEFPIIGHNNSFYDVNICKHYDFISKFGASNCLKVGQKYKSLFIKW